MPKICWALSAVLLATLTAAGVRYVLSDKKPPSGFLVEWEIDAGENGGSVEMLVPQNYNRYYFSPSWSPDGKKIAFWGIEIPKGCRIVGADPLKVEGSDGRLRFCEASWRMGSLDLSNRSVRQFAVAEGAFPSWSPDGRRLAFSDHLGVWILDLKSQQRELLVKNNLVDGEEDYALYRCPVWSPDGRELALIHDYNEGSTVALFDVEQKTSIEVGNGDYAWSPDGKRFVSGGRYSEADYDRPGIFISSSVNAVKENNVLNVDPYLMEEYAFPFWPDPDTILFLYAQGESDPVSPTTVKKWGCHQIRRIKPDGGGLEKVADLGCYVSVAAWSENGNRLAYVKDGNIWVFDRITRSNRAVTRFSGLGREIVSGLAWSPDGRRLAFSREGTIWLVQKVD